MIEKTEAAKLTEVIEAGATAAATVVSGLGYPNNRAAVSAASTGWRASKIGAAGTAETSSQVGGKSGNGPVEKI